MENKNMNEQIEEAESKFVPCRKNFEAISVLECDFKIDSEKKNLEVYYKGKKVHSDYILSDDHSYLSTALALFKTATPRSKQSKWYNLYWLIVLRHIVRENYNHGIGLDDILYEEKPLTFERIKKVRKMAKEIDKYASIP